MAVRTLDQSIGVAAEIGLVGIAEQPVHLVSSDVGDVMAQPLGDLKRAYAWTRGLDEDEVDHGLALSGEFSWNQPSAQRVQDLSSPERILAGRREAIVAVGVGVKAHDEQATWPCR